METTWWTQPEDLDEYQGQVVALPLDGDFLVVGPPGSGKTNLLILRAAHLYAAGYKNIAIITFGRVLREFLAAGSKNYVFPPDRIQTYNSWASRLLKANDIDVPGTGSFNEVRAALMGGLLQLEKTMSAENKLDFILVDETQDYTKEEIRIMRSFSDHIFAVGDNKQRIYKEDGAVDYLSGEMDATKELPYHYRNGRTICRVADGIRNLVDDAKGLEATSNYDEKSFPSSVSVTGELDIRAQVRVALPEIATQLRAYPDGMIGCICARHEELQIVWDILRQSDLSDRTQLQVYGEYSTFDSSRRVLVTTMHSAKGLEFRALHVFGADQIVKHKKSHQRLAYTAVTRAKTSLAIYHGTAALPGYMENGLGAATDTIVKAPKLSDLFKKG